MTADLMNAYVNKIDLLEETLRIEKEKNKLLKQFIQNHIDIIEKEIAKDGWCRLDVDQETVKEFKKALEGVK